MVPCRRSAYRGLQAGARLGFGFFDPEDELTQLFGWPVDLVARISINRNSINKYIRNEVLHDTQLLYAS